MENVVVSIPLDPQLAESIGKKSSEGSITFYNRKMADRTIIGLAPTSIMDKFFAVAECLLLSSSVVVSTKDIDSLFGEVVVASSLLEKRRILMTDDSNVDAMAGSIGMKPEYCARDSIVDKLLPPAAIQGGAFGTRVDIDKAFPVKGLGTIVLGIVTAGKVAVHQNLFHTTGKSVLIRSIQSQDQDVQEAGVGTRVGLAIKGMEHEEIEKGTLFTDKKLDPVTDVKVSIKGSKIAAESIIPGNTYSLASNFNHVVCKVVSFESGSATLKLEKAVPLATGDDFLLLRSKVPRIFAGGKIS
jgi:hypothetical protein